MDGANILMKSDVGSKSEKKIFKKKQTDGINVLMMGGRRAGKTSILAAMNECVKEVLITHQGLKFPCTSGTVSLSDKQDELEAYFTDPKYTSKMEFIPDINPSSGKTLYSFQLRVNDGIVSDIVFTDIPGEAYEEENAGLWKDTVEKLLNDSRVCIIAIDTPHLMEEYDKNLGYGKYHEEYNRVREITNFFKKSFQNSKDIRDKARLVIFVPIKCEKYYYRNRMTKVTESIKNGYRELLDFFAAPQIKEICTVAISPCLTIGGAEFFKFDENSYVGRYQYRDEPDEYLPKYCEQPLLLTIEFMLTLARIRAQGKLTVSRIFNEVFFNDAKLKDLKEHTGIISGSINKSKADGFEIIQDPLSMA